MMTTDIERAFTPKQVRPDCILHINIGGDDVVTCVSVGSEFATNAGDIYLRKNHEYWFQRVNKVNDYLDDPTKQVKLVRENMTQANILQFISDKNLGAGKLKMIARSVTKEYDWVSTDAVDFKTTSTVKSFHFNPTFAPTPASPTTPTTPDYQDLVNHDLQLTLHSEELPDGSSVLIGASWSHTEINKAGLWDLYWDHRLYNFSEDFNRISSPNGPRFHYSESSRMPPFLNLPT